jgi:hypothetical protein
MGGNKRPAETGGVPQTSRSLTSAASPRTDGVPQRASPARWCDCRDGRNWFTCCSQHVAVCSTSPGPMSSDSPPATPEAAPHTRTIQLKNPANPARRHHLRRGTPGTAAIAGCRGQGQGGADRTDGGGRQGGSIPQTGQGLFGRRASRAPPLFTGGAPRTLVQRSVTSTSTTTHLTYDVL